MNHPIAKGKVEHLAINGKPVTEVMFDLNGPVGDIHSGFERKLSGHDNVYIATSNLKKGAPVFNWRTWTGLSWEELAEIEEALDHKIPEGCLLENITFSGIPNFSKLEPGSRLVLPYYNEGGITTQAILAIWEENAPCATVGKRLEEIHGTVGLTKDFVREAYNRRGLMGFVLSPGKTKPGDQVLVYPPVR